MWTYFVIIICCSRHLSVASNEYLSPINVSDSDGNHADRNSTITWGPIPQPSDPYLSDTSEKAVPPGLEVFLKMVNAFTYVVQPQDPPYGKWLFNI